ncbi:MFS transporter [Methylovirgula sp. 4M-Z18]|uniref:MFS transporter n=1 Tax=Methylovirgula sp. 4M-Z18 TaxID=2293567 RepID=UPI000E2F00BA|nr:MFS transporter [Methylovirgula sp. 4M-Z18]RFB78959.1 MFS transporter [Methylovirgula sp. 4M-Z18]
MSTERRFSPTGSLVWGLAASQLFGWATLYYAFTLFVQPMRQELGWSDTALNGALTFGLFIGDLAAIPIGRWVDRRGGHAIMTAGAALGALALVLWSGVHHLVSFYAIWGLIGLAQASSLINPAMTVVTANVTDYRRAITYVSFVTGLASSLAWPMANQLIAAFGWRPALLALAIVQIAVPLLVNAIVLRGTRGTRVDHEPMPLGSDAGRASPLRQVMRLPAFWTFALAFSIYWFVSAGTTIHMLPILRERGIAQDTAVVLVSLYGPAQVFGRMALFVLVPDFSARSTGRIMFPLWAFTLLLLLVIKPLGLSGLIIFSMLFGSTMGTLLILRQTGVVEIFGARGYGTITGALSTVSILPRTTAPWIFALMRDSFGGYDGVIAIMFVLTAIGCVAYWSATRAAQDGAAA